MIADDMDANGVIDILLQKEFPQGRLFNLGDFLSIAEERGVLGRKLGREDFEHWDRLGVLRPVIKIRRSFTYHRVTGYSECAIRYDPEPMAKAPTKGEKVIRIYDEWGSNLSILSKPARIGTSESSNRNLGISSTGAVSWTRQTGHGFSIFTIPSRSLA